MTKSFSVVLAISCLLFSFMACQTQQGVTLSVSLTGQPSGIATRVGSTESLSPSVYYRGKGSALNLSYNVLSAPQGGEAIITPRSTVVTVSSAGAVVKPATVSFSIPGTYVIQIQVQEVGSGDLSATDQTTYVVAPALASG